MASVIDIIGFVSSVIGIVQFAQDAFPAKQKPGSSVRIAVGLDSTGGLNNAGGNTPGVALFNEAGAFLGQTQNNGNVQDGSFADLTITQSSGQQATYGLIQAGHDAVCIAYTSITWPDGNQYALTGDWGAACGGNWYYSNIYVQGSGYKPKCMWIDSDGGQPQTGFQVHFPEFRSDTSTLPAGKDVQTLCNSKAPFQYFTTPGPQTIDYWNADGKTTSQSTVPAKRDAEATSRASRRATTTTPSALVITNATDHSAKQICGSKTSSGPDLLNLSEKSFCRMSDKTTFPQCDTTVKDNCFDANSKQLITGAKAARAPYAVIWDWQTPGKTLISKLASSAKIAAREPYPEPQPYDNIINWSVGGAKADVKPSKST